MVQLADDDMFCAGALSGVAFALDAVVKALEARVVNDRLAVFDTLSRSHS